MYASLAYNYAKHVSLLSESNEMPLVVLGSRNKVSLSWSTRHIVGHGGGWVLIRIWTRTQKFQGTLALHSYCIHWWCKTICLHHFTRDAVSFCVHFAPLKFHRKSKMLYWRSHSKGGEIMLHINILICWVCFIQLCLRATEITQTFILSLPLCFHKILPF